jgi:ankyrin repeat protein
MSKTEDNKNDKDVKNFKNNYPLFHIILINANYAVFNLLISNSNFCTFAISERF